MRAKRAQLPNAPDPESFLGFACLFSRFDSSANNSKGAQTIELLVELHLREIAHGEVGVMPSFLMRACRSNRWESVTRFKRFASAKSSQGVSRYCVNGSDFN